MRRKKHHGAVTTGADACYTSGSEAITITKALHSKPTPTTPIPTKPTPAIPTSTKPTPAIPTLTKPTPTKPTSIKPTLTKPTPRPSPKPTPRPPPKPTPRPPPKPSIKGHSTQAPNPTMAPPTLDMEFQPNLSYSSQVFYTDGNMYEELDITRGEKPQNEEHEYL